MFIKVFWTGHWKELPLQNSDVILVRLYGGDFEPANPLG